MCKPTHPGADDATAASLGADDAATAAAKQDATTTTTKTTTRIIARSELAMRNSPSSAWCAIRATSGGGRRGGGSSSSSRGEVGGGGDDDDAKNKKERDDDGDGRYIVLDVTRFATVHPGGDLILLGAGKDASVLFETYHPRGVPGALIEKLRIGTMEAGCFDGSFYSWDSDFYPTLKRRVVDRLAERGLDRRGSIEIRIKAALLLLGFWYSLFEMAYASRGDHFLVSAAWSISMGIFAALIGVNVQHDGNHGAFATSKFANKIAGWTMDMIGASAFTWEMQHMLGHHPYTNVLDAAEDDRRGKGVDCKMEEKDQVRAVRFCVRGFTRFARPHNPGGALATFVFLSFFARFVVDQFSSRSFSRTRGRGKSHPPPPSSPSSAISSPPSRSPTRTFSPPSP